MISVLVIPPENISSRSLIYKRSSQKHNPDLLFETCVDLNLKCDKNDVYKTLISAGCIVIITMDNDLFGWTPSEIILSQYITVKKLKNFFLRFSYFDFSPWFDYSYNICTNPHFEQRVLIDTLFERLEELIIKPTKHRKLML